MGNANKKYYQTPEFLQLKIQWYEKLKESGFVDIESGVSISERPFSHRAYRNDLFYTSTFDYYNKCREYLNIGEFEKHTIKETWELHCEGLTIREISKRLNLHQTTVFRRIDKHRKIMIEMGMLPS